MKAKRLKESGLCLAFWVMKVGALNSTEREEKTALMSADPRRYVRRTFLCSVFVKLFLQIGVVNRPLFL